MVNVLVTGGAGYIGSRLIPRLLKENYSVTVLDNFMYGQSSLLECCSDPNFSVVRGDCRDELILKPLVEKAEVIIPLAALVGFPLCDKDKMAAVSTNLQAIQSMLQWRSLQQRVLISCTNSGYGIGSEGKYCTEETPMNPISLYGKTKVQAENFILSFLKKKRFNVCILRLATIFGLSPRMRFDLLINQFTKDALMKKPLSLESPCAWRPFLHVQDAARALIYCLQVPVTKISGEIFNVGCGNYQKKEIAQLIKKHIPGTDIKMSAGAEDSRDYKVSFAKVKKRLGFKTKFSLERGIVEIKQAIETGIIDDPESEKYSNLKVNHE